MAALIARSLLSTSLGAGCGPLQIVKVATSASMRCILRARESSIGRWLLCVMATSTAPERRLLICLMVAAKMGLLIGVVWV